MPALAIIHARMCFNILFSRYLLHIIIYAFTVLAEDAMKRMKLKAIHIVKEVALFLSMPKPYRAISRPQLQEALS